MTMTTVLPRSRAAVSFRYRWHKIHTTAHSGNQAQDHHAQGVQGLAQGRHSAGHGKGRRAQQFQKNKKLFHSAP